MLQFANISMIKECKVIILNFILQKGECGKPQKNFFKKKEKKSPPNFCINT